MWRFYVATYFIYFYCWHAARRRMMLQRAGSICNRRSALYLLRPQDGILGTKLYSRDVPVSSRVFILFYYFYLFFYVRIQERWGRIRTFYQLQKKKMSRKRMIHFASRTGEHFSERDTLQPLTRQHKKRYFRANSLELFDRARFYHPNKSTSAEMS